MKIMNRILQMLNKKYPFEKPSQCNLLKNSEIENLYTNTANTSAGPTRSCN